LRSRFSSKISYQLLAFSPCFPGTPGSPPPFLNHSKPIGYTDKAQLVCPDGQKPTTQQYT